MRRLIGGICFENQAVQGGFANGFMEISRVGIGHAGRNRKRQPKIQVAPGVRPGSRKRMDQAAAPQDSPKPLESLESGRMSPDHVENHGLGMPCSQLELGFEGVKLLDLALLEAVPGGVEPSFADGRAFSASDSSFNKE